MYFWCVAGLTLCLTVVGIPFGLQAIKMGVASLAPFGKKIESGKNANGPIRIIFNVLWTVLFGWELALHHLFWALLWAITVVGLPFAAQHVKLAAFAIMPFGREFS